MTIINLKNKNMFELKCTVHAIGEIQNISEKFQKRELIGYVEDTNNEKFSDYIPFEATPFGGAMDLLNEVKVGDVVYVKFKIGGRKWEKDGTTRYFGSNQLLGMDVETKAGARMQVVKGLNSGGGEQEPQYASAPPSDEGDSLPF